MSTLKVDAITDTSGGTNVDVPNAAKAWVNFNGTGTVAIREDFNVLSITDNGSGDYTVNFATSMPDADYAGFITPGGLNAGNATNNWYSISQTSSGYRIFTSYSPVTAYDYSGIQVGIFR